MNGITTHAGDCRDVLANMPADSIDSCVTDPPYGLEFMGKEWDKFRPSGSEWSRKVATGKDWKGKERIRPGRLYMRSSHQTCRTCGKQSHEHDDAACGADYERVTHAPTQMRAYGSWCEDWAREVYRVLKPGAHLLAFGGTRTAHRMVCAIKDAGFEIRDTLCWIYGSGFPKSLDVGKAIDRAAGRPLEDESERPGEGLCRHIQPPVAGGMPGSTATVGRFHGWGTALKPAYEPIVLARKPLVGTVAANVLAHGTGALNVDGCRIGTSKDVPASVSRNGQWFAGNAETGGEGGHDPALGRWPANVLHDGSPEVEAAFAVAGERTSGEPTAMRGTGGIWSGESNTPCGPQYGDTGSASRFFYCAKADSGDRADSRHPTVKPVDLMRWLVRLITPPNGTVLDPFAGSGTTAEAAMLEGMRAILIEQDAQHVADIRHRMGRWSGQDLPLFTSWPPADDPADTHMADLFAGHGS